MYFKEKENTNIDGELETKKSFDIQKYKPLILIIGGVVVLFVIIFIVFSLTKKPEEPVEPVTSYNLELNGAQEITITLGNDYIEPGYNAYDSAGNDISSMVSISSNININEPGTYEVTYTVYNETKTRFVKITEQTQETYIYLKGNKNIYLDLGEKYIEPGYVSHDTIDGDLTKKVKVSGKVNYNKKGLYKIVYSVINSRKITTQIERNVIVGETKPLE